MMLALWTDCRAAAISVIRNARHIAVATLTLAIGIATSVAVAGIVDATLFQRLPYTKPEELSVISGRTRTTFVEPLSSNQYEPLPELSQGPSLVGATAVVAGDVTLSGDPVRRVRAASVSAAYFDVLGIRAIAGRVFTGRDSAHSKQIAVISERLWRERFNRDDSAIGSTVSLNTQLFVVVGVLPAAVQFPNVPDVWIPSGADRQVGGDYPSPIVVVRSAPGGTVTGARHALERIRADRGDPASFAQFIQIESLTARLRGPIRPWWLVLASATLLLLVVGSVNVAGLLLIRTTGRSREFLVRLAVGATRTDLATQVAVEVLLITFVAAVLSTPIAIWLLSVAPSVLPPTLHGVATIAFGWTSLTSTAAFLAGAVLIAGWAPVLISYKRGTQLLNGRERTLRNSKLWHQLRSAFVILQVAAALVLLVGALSIGQSMARILDDDIGVRGQNALVLQVTPPRARYNAVDKARQLYETIDAEFGSITGVEHVGIVSHLPGTQTGNTVAIPVQVDGLAVQPNTAYAVQIAASPGYFAAIGLPLIAGRTYDVRQSRATTPVVLVSASVARAAGVEPGGMVGHRLNLATVGAPEPIWADVLGIVGDVRFWGQVAPRPAIYVPMSYDPPRGGAFVVLKRKAGVSETVRLVGEALARIDRDLPLLGIKELDAVRADYMREQSLAVVLVGGLGVLAALLASIGLYATVRHRLDERSREFGIEMALGSSSSRLQRRTLFGGLLLACSGVLLGSAVLKGAWEALRAHASQVGPLSVFPLCAVAVILIGVAAFGSWLSARRATSIDVLQVLRRE